MGNPTASAAATPRLEDVTIVEASDRNPQPDTTVPGTSRSRLRTFAIMVGLCVRVHLQALETTANESLSSLLYFSRP